MIAHSVYECGGAVSFLKPSSTGFAQGTFSRTFVMGKRSQKTEINRVEILRQSYRLMAMGTWDAISVTELENNIEQTRGAIFYFNKNKKALFTNMIEELFLPVFKLSDSEKSNLKTCSPQTFFAIYKTPFERVCDDLRINYQVPEPSRSLFNIIIQAQKHYQGFKQIIRKEIKQEIAFIHHIIGINSTLTLDLDKIYALSAGRIFLDSLC